MAYREFYQRQDIMVPDYSGLERGIHGLFAGIAQRQRDQRTMAQRFQYDLNGGFESDQKIFNEMAGNITRDVVANKGVPSPNTRWLMQQGKGWAELSNIQKKQTEELNKTIDDIGIRNKYYDTTTDYLSLQRVSDPEVNFQTRGAILDDVKKNIGNPRNFKTHQYVADYVKGLQRSFKEKTYGTPDAKNTKYDQSTFWDEATGKPGVTDEHAIDLLKSDPMLKDNFNMQIEDQIRNEISRMKDSGDESVSWMKDMKEDEIVAELIANPSRNILNSRNFGDRVRDYAKRELEKINAIDSRTSYEKKEPKTPEGPIKNDAIGHTDTFFNNRITTEGVSDRVAAASGMSGVSGPGGVLMIGKGVSGTGKPITLDIDANQSFNIRTGKNSQRSSGKFNVTGYHLQTYDKNGNLYPLQANSYEDMKNAINGMSNATLRSMGPEMKVAIDGYAVNDKAMLNDIASKSFDISEQIGMTTDPETRAELEFQLEELKRLRTMINLEGISDEDIIHAANKQGINKIRQDQILLPTQSDLDRIKATTQGLDLKNKDHWSPEMRELNDLYKKKYQQAIASEGKTTPKKETFAAKVITSDGSDLDTWVKGNQYKVGNNIYFYDKASGQWAKK